MGRDVDQYVHPERISSQLICPICTQVLQNPVQTETEHLFCEDELLEWMTRSNLCPITKTMLNPSTIKKPSRIIMNMLAELEIYCNYKDKGCTWIGKEEHLDSHLEKDCVYHQNSLLQEAVELQGAKLQESIELIAQLELRNNELLQENILLKQLVDEYQQRLRLFHALIPETVPGKNPDRPSDEYRADRKSSSNPSSAPSSPDRQGSSHSGRFNSELKKLSDAERLKRLTGLKIINSSADSDVKDFEAKEARK